MSLSTRTALKALVVYLVFGILHEALGVAYCSYRASAGAPSDLPCVSWFWTPIGLMGSMAVWPLIALGEVINGSAVLVPPLLVRAIGLAFLVGFVPVVWAIDDPVRAKRFAMGLAVVCCLVGARVGYSNRYPSMPQGPTEADLARIESRFPALRPQLEHYVFVQQEWTRIAHRRDTLAAIGDTQEIQRLEREYRARQLRLPRWGGPSFPRTDVGDSLMCFVAWSRRHHDDFWYSAGYMYSSRPPGTRPCAPKPAAALYKHLGGSWYLYSIDERVSPYR